MHAIKVAVELLLIVAVMRLMSLGLGWALARVLGIGWFPSALIANAGALAIFTGFIVWDLAPGQPFDYEAFAFGVAVYASCLVADLKWRPWHRQQARQTASG
jgi:hypothetical protein